jgi:DNA-binding transcriptional ArsR family regulator
VVLGEYVTPHRGASLRQVLSANVTPKRDLKLTDPRLMRALAHPARIAIWQYLGLEGPATATECAEVVGMSPSACSYHLRALAGYGFAEEDPASAADGRQRPWRGARRRERGASSLPLPG